MAGEKLQEHDISRDFEQAKNLEDSQLVLKNFQISVVNEKIDALGNPEVHIHGSLMIDGKKIPLTDDMVEIDFKKKSQFITITFIGIGELKISYDGHRDSDGDWRLTKCQDHKYEYHELAYDGGWIGKTQFLVFLTINGKENKYTCEVAYDAQEAGNKSSQLDITLEPAFSIDDIADEGGNIKDISDENAEQVTTYITEHIDTQHLGEGRKVQLDKEQGSLLLALKGDSLEYMSFVDESTGGTVGPISLAEMQDIKSHPGTLAQRLFRDGGRRSMFSLFYDERNDTYIAEKKPYKSPYLIIANIGGISIGGTDTGVQLGEEFVSYTQIEREPSFVSKKYKNPDNERIFDFSLFEPQTLVVEKRDVLIQFPESIALVEILTEDEFVENLDFSLASNTLQISSQGTVMKTFPLPENIKYIQQPTLLERKSSDDKIVYIKVEKNMDGNLNIQVNTSPFVPLPPVDDGDIPIVDKTGDDTSSEEYDDVSDNTSDTSIESLDSKYIYTIPASAGLTREDGNPIRKYDVRLYNESGALVVMNPDKKSDLYVVYDEEDGKIYLRRSDTTLGVDGINPDDEQLSFDARDILSYIADGNEISLMVNDEEMSLFAYKKDGVLRFGVDQRLLDRRKEHTKSDIGDVIEPVKEQVSGAIATIEELPHEFIKRFKKNRPYDKVRDIPSDIVQAWKSIDRGVLFPSDTEGGENGEGAEGGKEKIYVTHIQDYIEGHGSTPHSIGKVMTRKWAEDQTAIRLFYDPGWGYNGYDQIGFIKLTPKNVKIGVKEGIEIDMDGPFRKEAKMRVYFLQVGDRLIIQVDVPDERIPEDENFENTEILQDGIWPVDGYGLKPESISVRKKYGNIDPCDENDPVARKIGRSGGLHGYVGARDPKGTVATPFHKGIDISQAWDKNNHETILGKDVRLPRDGEVTFTGPLGGYGKHGIKIKTIIRGKPYEMLFGHLQSLASGIQKGKKLKKGTVIGKVGNEGRSTGAHLHRGMRELNKNGTRKKLVDPTRFFTYPGLDPIKRTKDKVGYYTWKNEEVKQTGDEKFLEFLTYKEAKEVFESIFGTGPAVQWVEKYANGNKDLFIRIIALARHEGSLLFGRTNEDASGGWDRGTFQIRSMTTQEKCKEKVNKNILHFLKFAAEDGIDTKTSPGLLNSYHEYKGVTIEAERDLETWIGYILRRASFATTKKGLKELGYGDREDAILKALADPKLDKKLATGKLHFSHKVKKKTKTETIDTIEKFFNRTIQGGVADIGPGVTKQLDIWIDNAGEMKKRDKRYRVKHYKELVHKYGGPKDIDITRYGKYITYTNSTGAEKQSPIKKINTFLKNADDFTTRADGIFSAWHADFMDGKLVLADYNEKVLYTFDDYMSRFLKTNKGFHYDTTKTIFESAPVKAKIDGKKCILNRHLTPTGEIWFGVKKR